MRHIRLTNRHNQKIIAHCDVIKEVWPANDGENSVVVLDVKKKDGDDTYVVVNETEQEIWDMLKALKYDNNEKA